MIQTLGDVLVLVTIISVGVVAFLLAIFLYHLVFVVMDLRKVMKRVNEITAQIEDMLVKPVEVAGVALGWAQKLVFDLIDMETTAKPKKAKKAKKAKPKKEKKKRKKGGFKKKKV